MELDEMLKEMDLTSFLFKCYHDFEFFCNNVLADQFSDGGIKTYMLEWVELVQKKDRVCILAPSGFAKTTVLGVAYPLWIALIKKNQEIMIISNSERQSKAVLGKIKSIIETNPLLNELKPKDYRETWSAKEIKTNTNCHIFVRPFTRNVKGVRVDYIIMDEAASYKDPDMYFDYIVPRLNPKGKIVLISTIENAMDLMSLIKERSLTEYEFREYPAIINGDLETGESIWSERFPMEKLRKIRNEQGEQYFQKNFMNNLITEMGKSIFSADTIEFAKDREFKFTTKSFGGQITIGCDFGISSGPTSDFDAFVVSETIVDRAIIKYGEFHRGLPVNVKSDKIEELYNKFGAHTVICDETSIGMEVIKELRIRGIPTEGQSFHSQARNKLLNNLRSLLDSGRIKLPADPNDVETKRFIDKLELELLSFVEKKLTTITSYVSTGAHDDLVMALAMAVKKVQSSGSVQDHWGFPGSEQRCPICNELVILKGRDYYCEEHGKVNPENKPIQIRNTQISPIRPIEGGIVRETNYWASVKR